MLPNLTLYVDTVLFTVLPLCVDIHYFGCITMHRVPHTQLLLTALSLCAGFLNRLNIYFN